MSKQKYTNYSSKLSRANAEPTADETMIPASEVIDQVINEEFGNAEPEVAPPVEPKTGIVTANKLNIRKAPSKGAEVVTIVDKNTVLMIDLNYESIEWFKVCTAAGAEGYCMREFVEIK